MKTAQPKADASGSGALVGKLFLGRDLSLKDCQGQVDAYCINGFYLITAFSWLTGDPMFQTVVSIEDLCGCEFFDCREDLVARASVVRMERQAITADLIGRET